MTKSMNKKEIIELQNIIQGQSYRESLILKAIDLAPSLEVKLCLKALRRGICTFESRMVLGRFVCELQEG